MQIDLKFGDVALRSFSATDKSRLVLLMNNKQVVKSLTDRIPHPYTEKDAENFISFCSSCCPITTFAIEYKSEMVGCIGLVVQEDVQRLSAEMGYWIGEPYWNRGIATTAVKLMVQYGFKRLGMVRIFSEVFDFNTPSQKVLEKAGFNFDCTMKKAAIKDGKICDLLLYSVVND